MLRLSRGDSSESFLVSAPVSIGAYKVSKTYSDGEWDVTAQYVTVPPCHALSIHGHEPFLSVRFIHPGLGPWSIPQRRLHKIIEGMPLPILRKKKQDTNI